MNRKEISPGIWMEKYQEKEGDSLFYIMNIELKLFQEMSFTVDFEGSKNVSFVSQSEALKRNIVLQPFTKVEVARLLLSRNWSLKTKFNFILSLPSIELQRKQLDKVKKDLDDEMEKSYELKKFDLEFQHDSSISTLLKTRHHSFVDSSFPPTNDSIGLSEDKIIEKYKCIVHWRRPEEFALNEKERQAGESIELFTNEVSPFDVRIGNLESEGLVSALAAMAEQPKLISRLFLTKSRNGQGFVKMKVCYMGRWKPIVVDDLVPCAPLWEPLFSRNIGHELWVSLIEKMLAKHYGSYKALEDRGCKQFLYDLTACPVDRFDFEAPDVAKSLSSGQFFQLLRSYLKMKFLISAETRGKREDEVHRGLGYSLVEVVESKGHRLMRFRDPWLVNDWSGGEWVEGSANWTDELKEEINPIFSEDFFWLSFEEFTQHFIATCVVKVWPWQQVSMKGKFVTSLDHKSPSSIFCSRYHYQIQVTTHSKVIIGIHQEDENLPFVKETRPYIDIGLALLTYSDGQYRLIAHTDSKADREVFLDMELEPGEYLIVPFSAGLLVKPECFEHQPKLSDISVNNPVLRSILRNAFEKADISSKGLILYPELQQVMQLIGLKVSQEEFELIYDKFGKRRLPSGPEGFSLEGFLLYFGSLIDGITFSEKMEILNKLGYNEEGFSFRSRMFNLTLHSEHLVKINSKDALKENIDQIFFQVLLKKFGTNFVRRTDVLPQDNSVEPVVYINE